MDRNASVGTLKGIGEKTSALFEKLDIHTVNELLHYYPKNYDSYEPPCNIESLKTGQTCTVKVTIAKSAQMKKVKNLTIISAYASDDTGMIKVTWFNMPFLRNTIKQGAHMILRGRVVKTKYEITMEQPAIYKADEYMKLCGSRQPVYALTAGLSNKTVVKAVKQALSAVGPEKEYMPENIRHANELAEINFAVNAVHFPQSETELVFARKRLVFDEFFLFILGIRLLKEHSSDKKNVYDISQWDISQKLIESLPYELTNAQKKVWHEIKSDLMGNKLMNRLVQGDVGSGKTILAVLSLITVVENGYQGALMAPTEVLARQHYESVSDLFARLEVKVPSKNGNLREINIVLITGSMTAKEKRQAYEKVESHEADIIIGTHALIQEKVRYADLALVITDEQHRFGVKQREMLSKKAVGDGGEEGISEPHILVMSATPIPRTLALILYGDLDISIVDEQPSERLQIKNCVVDTGYRKNAYKFIESEVSKGRQAYIICPLASESEIMDAENVIDYTQKIREEFSSQVRIEYLHGKMKPKEKDSIMERFGAQEIDILVSTTVVEVGINVPNATVMMVENAERFGLAQLHQLRGRVGRGKYQSYCIFINSSGSDEKNRRLEILNKSNDGFYIAAEDLKLRGPGDMFGIKQSGMLDFTIGDIYNDADILKTAARAADEILDRDPEFKNEENIELGRKVKTEMIKRISRLYL